MAPAMRQLDPQRRGDVDTRDGEPAAAVLIRVPDLNAPRKTLEVAPRPETVVPEQNASETAVAPRWEEPAREAQEEQAESTAARGPSSGGLRSPLAGSDEKVESAVRNLPSAASGQRNNRPSLREKLSRPSSRGVPPLAVLAGVMAVGVFLGAMMLRGGSDADAGPSPSSASSGDRTAESGGLAPPYAPPRVEIDPSLKLRAEEPPQTVEPPQATAAAEPAAEPSAEPDSMPWPRSSTTSAAAKPRGPVYQARRPAAEFEGTIAKPR